MSAPGEASPSRSRSATSSTARRVVVEWDDDHESVFPLDYLRSWCPCASCQGHAPTAKYLGLEGQELVHVDGVGNYADLAHLAGRPQHRDLQLPAPARALPVRRLRGTEGVGAASERTMRGVPQILKVPPGVSSEDDELDFELAYQRSLTTAQRFEMMLSRSRQIAEELIRRGHRKPVEIVKRSWRRVRRLRLPARVPRAGIPAWSGSSSIVFIRAACREPRPTRGRWRVRLRPRVPDDGAALPASSTSRQEPANRERGARAVHAGRLSPAEGRERVRPCMAGLTARYLAAAVRGSRVVDRSGCRCARP